MSTGKHFDRICIVVIALTLVLTVLFMCGKSLGITPIVSEETSSNSLFTENDVNADWDTANATEIVLSEGTATVSGNGAYCSDGVLYIVYAGKYHLTGAFSGNVKIDCDGDDKVWLLFDGVEMTSETAPLVIEQAEKVFLTLKDGSENRLTYSGSDDTIDGAIFSRDDLTINGSGKLTVTSEKQHGIVCNDSLVFAGGEITISAEEDAVHAHDWVKIRETSFQIAAGDDGIHVGNDDETAAFYLESGDITITTCYEGIEANRITIAGGKVSIQPEDDGLNANGSGNNSMITISGGDVTVLNSNGRDADGIDSNGSILISGGRLFISLIGSGATNSAIDYGSENGGTCVVIGGTVIACGASGMAEGFEESSTQGFIMQSMNGDENAAVSLADADGNILLEETIPYAFSSIVISVPNLAVGDEVTLKVGDTTTDITVDNTTGNGMGGMGGMGNFGGNRQNPFDMNQGEETENSDAKGNPGENQNPFENGDNNTAPEKPSGEISGDFEPGDMPNDQQNGQPNGRGGNKNPFDNGNGNTPSEMPSGEMPGDAQPGEMPSDFQPGEMPSGEMPSGEVPEMPSGEIGENGQGGFNGEQNDNPQQQDQQQSPNNEQTKTESNKLTSETWILLGVSILVLAGGMFIVLKKKV